MILAQQSVMKARSDRLSVRKNGLTLVLKSQAGTLDPTLRAALRAEKEAILSLLADGSTLGARESLVMVFERRRRAWIESMKAENTRQLYSHGPSQATLAEVRRRVSELRDGQGWDPLLAWYRVHVELADGKTPEEADKLTAAWRRATVAPDEVEVNP